MRIISGIYRIVNVINNKSYIGSSKNIIRRWYFHKSALKNNRHHCIYLQRSWNKHGKDSFKFEIIAEIPFISEEHLLAKELKVIKERLPEYNIGAVGGGDNLTNNPNRDDIIRRIVASIKNRVSKMSDEERKRIWSRPGKSNPNWRGGTSSPKCDTCNKQLHHGRKKCSLCSKLGEHNPFYGKHHSELTKNKLKIANKGKLPPNLRSVKLDSIVYPSVTEASRQLNVCPATILFRIKSQYWDYDYVTPQHPS